MPQSTTQEKFYLLSGKKHLDQIITHNYNDYDFTTNGEVIDYLGDGLYKVNAVCLNEYVEAEGWFVTDMLLTSVWDYGIEWLTDNRTALWE